MQAGSLLGARLILMRCYVSFYFQRNHYSMGGVWVMLEKAFNNIHVSEVLLLS